MTPKRLSREESQQATRQRLLDAALEEFSRQGYHAASLDVIAERAGYSKGAIYSNFSSKEDLFLALIDRRFASEAVAFSGIGDFMIANLNPKSGPEFKELVMQDRSWNLLMIEFFLYAIRDESNRSALAGRLEQLRSEMAASLAALYARSGQSPELPVGELPWSIFSLGVGLALQFYVDPDSLPEGVYEHALRQILAARA